MRRLRNASLAILAFLAATTGAGPASAEDIPLETFGKRPFLEDPELSPSGEQMAATIDVEGTPVVAIINLAHRDQAMKMVRVGEHRVRWYRWAGTDRLLISLRMKATYSGFDGYASRLLVYDVGSGKATYLGYDSQGIEGDRVIFVARDGSYALISLGRAAFAYPAVYRADLATGKMTVEVEPTEPISDWYADYEGRVRAGIGYQGGFMRMYVRAPGDSYFRHAASYREEEMEGEIDMIRIPSTGTRSYVLTNRKTGRFGLYEFDWASGEIGKAIFEHPEVDVDDFTLTEDGSAVEGVYFTDDRPRVEWLDPQFREIQREIDEALPGRMNRILSASRDRSKVVVRTMMPGYPGAYFLYDRPQEQMARLATPYQGLEGKKLAAVSVVRYAARDGLAIPAYLTLPEGREPKGLPLIILPHGGPYARDWLGFDWWAQFLANRGYAILQPNFRGSSGFGKEFLEKGFGQWGRAMQEDLADGVRWLAAEGTIDPKRVCIAGASYGGYAALMGAIQSPELYRCAISWAGVTDIDQMMQYDKMQLLPGRYRRLRDRLRGADPQDLDKVSPQKLAGKIAVPVLAMHGTEDETVPIQQGRAFAKAAKKAAGRVEYLEFEGAGHPIEKSADRIRFLTAIEDFLAKNNPAE